MHSLSNVEKGRKKVFDIWCVNVEKVIEPKRKEENVNLMDFEQWCEH